MGALPESIERRFINTGVQRGEKTVLDEGIDDDVGVWRQGIEIFQAANEASI